MTPEQIDAALALCDAATDGPWTAVKRRDNTYIDAGPDGYDEVIEAGDVACGSYCYGGSSRWSITEADAAFIAAARTGWPEALHAIQRVLALHREVGVYDVCEHTNGDECGAWETVDGEFVCGTPVDRVCEECRDESGEPVGHPCATVCAITGGTDE